MSGPILVDPKCPDNWALASFEGVAASFQNGCGVRRSEGGISTVVLRLADVSLSGHLAEGDALRLVGLSDGERHKYVLRTGDLLVFRVNGSRNITGQVVMYEGPEGFAYCDHFIRVRLAEGIDPRFIALQCGQGNTRRTVETGMVTTAGQNTISQGTLANVPLRVAPLAEQKRIVAKVEELTARSRRAKAALDAVRPLLDQLRQSILAAAFRGDLTAAWRAKNLDVEPADELLARIRTERHTTSGPRGAEPQAVQFSQLPSLPRGWSWATLEDLSLAHRSICYGVVQPGDDDGDGVPLVRVCDLVGDGLTVDTSSLRAIPATIDSDYERSRLEGGELLVSVVGTIGRTAIAPLSLRGANIARAVARVAFVLPWMAEWAAFWLNTGFMRDQLNRDAREVARKTLNIGTLAVVAVPIPGEAEALALLEILRSTHARLESLGAQAIAMRPQLNVLDSSILGKAFRGELATQDPNDEPASVLLERIRAARDSERGEPSGAPPRSRDAERVIEEPESARTGSRDLGEIEPGSLQDEVFAALWTHGPIEKDAAVRRVADHLRQAGRVQFERLRADGPLFGQVLDAIESAIKAGRLDRPRRGYVRATKADATTYTLNDSRHALVASLGPEPIDRDDAIRAAAEWARDNLGLEFARLREDGHILESLRSALNSAIRRGDVIRHDAKRISRAARTPPHDSTQVRSS
jgi:type I restriction enzyme S subunit